MPLGRTYDRAFNNSCTWQLLRKIAIGLVWWDLSGRVARPRLPALLTSACAEFLLRVLAALRLVLEIPCGTSCNQPLATNHCCKIKNPASSAGYSHSHLSGSTRCSTSFYPVFVKNLTIGSTSCLRLILRWEDLLRPDCDAPNHARRFLEPPGHL